MDYLSDKLTEEQLFKLTFDKGQSHDSVQVLKSALSNLEYFTKNQFNKTRLEVLDDLSSEFKKNRDTRAPIILLHRFREWLSEDHPDIIIPISNGGKRPLKAKRGKSQKDYLSHVKKWMRHCGGVKIDADDFRDFISIPNSALEEEDEVQPVTREELKEIIIHTMNPVRRAKFYFMKCTAARHLETLRVKKKYIDFSKDPVMVRLPKHIVKGKTRTRIVYLDKEAASKVEDICNRLNDDDYVFMSNDAKDIHFRNNENKWWGKLMVKLHMDQKGANGHLKKRIHSIRSFAMKAVEKGTGDSIMADAYGGHKKFVGRYLDKTEEERSEIFRRSEPYMSLFSETITVDNEELKEQHEKQMATLQKQIDDLKYGLKAREGEYAKSILNSDGWYKVCNMLFPLVFEFGRDEQYKRKFWKELTESQKENRPMNKAAYDPDYVEPTEEEKRERREYAKRRLEEFKKKKPAKKTNLVQYVNGKLKVKNPPFNEERVIRDMLSE